ncbi:MAG: hypothetical protein CV081_00410 [Nitrospira sp. LK265]|nr:hypothetical protein [Nitrospira sp. LK265]
MGLLITDAGRALAASDPLGALKRVALRNDALLLPASHRNTSRYLNPMITPTHHPTDVTLPLCKS